MARLVNGRVSEAVFCFQPPAMTAGSTDASSRGGAFMPPRRKASEAIRGVFRLVQCASRTGWKTELKPTRFRVYDSEPTWDIPSRGIDSELIIPSASLSILELVELFWIV